jgi:tRNA splicing ligase
MTATEIYSCLRDLQVIATVPRISEDEIRELVKKKLIQRTDKSGGIWLTELGVHTKTGQI